jgi:small subunit ribosomal protein S14
MVIKEGRRKYEVRVRNRCKLCGRPRGYMRRFGLCRICFRQEALQGKLPGVVKSSW